MSAENFSSHCLGHADSLCLQKAEGSPSKPIPGAELHRAAEAGHDGDAVEMDEDGLMPAPSSHTPAGL